MTHGPTIGAASLDKDELPAEEGEYPAKTENLPALAALKRISS